MIYVIARHGGQYLEYCSQAGLVPGYDVTRITRENQFAGTPPGLRVVLLHDHFAGYDKPDSLHEFLRSRDAYFTYARW